MAPTSLSVARDSTSTVCEYLKTVACIARSSPAENVFPLAAASRRASMRASPLLTLSSARVRLRAVGDGASAAFGADGLGGGAGAAGLRAPTSRSAARRTSTNERPALPVGSGGGVGRAAGEAPGTDSIFIADVSALPAG